MLTLGTLSYLRVTEYLFEGHLVYMIQPTTTNQDDLLYNLFPELVWSWYVINQM